jgi:hypothetical protein
VRSIWRFRDSKIRTGDCRQAVAGISEAALARVTKGLNADRYGFVNFQRR